jgi:hypothetical protein
MTAHTLPRHNAVRRGRHRLTLSLTVLSLFVVGAGVFVAFALWPTWPGAATPLEAPAIPTTVAGVLFDVPPAAIRNAVQRHTGPNDRLDLAFMWPSLLPPTSDPTTFDARTPDAKTSEAMTSAQAADAGDSEAAPDAGGRFFVTIAPLGPVLPPLQRLRGVYTHYVQSEAMAGADGLAILPFRPGTPYAGEDLVYLAGTPEQFFARCTEDVKDVPGTCMNERQIDATEVTFRFPRAWLNDWRSVSAGFDRLVAQMHPQNNQ